MNPNPAPTPKNLKGRTIVTVRIGNVQFVLQAWPLVTPTSLLCGRRGTWLHRPSFCVAGVALGDIDLKTTFLIGAFFW